jgi:hypothetical protein
MSDLTILKVKDKTRDDEKFAGLDSRLMRPPFRLLVNAPSGSGKSNMIQNLLFNDNFYKGMFDYIVYLSPTIHEDKTAQHMREMDDEKLILSDDVDKLDILVDNLMERQADDEHRDEHVLLVLDDCIGLIKKGSKLNTAIMKLRHYNVSVIMVTQYYRSVDPKVRENCSQYIFYKNANATEVKKIIDEVGGRFDDFKKYYEHATGEPYCFLFVDGYKLHKNFDKLLYDKTSGYRADT